MNPHYCRTVLCHAECRVEPRRKSSVSIGYPFSGNKRTLIRKEIASKRTKIIISRFVDEMLTGFPSIFIKQL